MNVIQFQDKRTGSTFLQRCLNSHPQITAYDELFVVSYKNNDILKSGLRPFKWKQDNDKKNGWSLQKYLNWVFAKNKNTSIKVMYNQEKRWGILPYIMENDIPVIHLIRKNHFKKVVSKATAPWTDTFHIDEYQKRFKPKNIIKTIKESKAEDARYSRKLRSTLSKYIIIYYEDMFGENDGKVTYLNDAYCRSICKFFGVDYFRMFADTKKKNKENVLVYFKDKNGMRRHLERNGMERYLNQ